MIRMWSSHIPPILLESMQLWRSVRILTETMTHTDKKKHKGCKEPSRLLAINVAATDLGLMRSITYEV